MTKNQRNRRVNNLMNEIWYQMLKGINNNTLNFYYHRYCGKSISSTIPDTLCYDANRTPTYHHYQNITTHKDNSITLINMSMCYGPHDALRLFIKTFESV